MTVRLDTFGVWVSEAEKRRNDWNWRASTPSVRRSMLRVADWHSREQRTITPTDGRWVVTGNTLRFSLRASSTTLLSILQTAGGSPSPRAGEETALRYGWQTQTGRE